MGRWISREAMAERRQRVADLKAQGLSHSTIAARLGITSGVSENDYKVYKREANNGINTGTN